MKLCFGMLRAAILGIILALVVMTSISLARVSGESMNPSLGTNDWVLVNKIAYLYDKPAYGDIVAFETDVYFSAESSNILVKRVVGLPGDTVEIRDGVLYRNGMPVDEAYAENVNSEEVFEPITVASNCVFVLGDNRTYSRDSRDEAIGQIDVSEVWGRVSIL